MRHVLLVIVPLACLAQPAAPPNFKVLDLQFKVVDLNHKVVDMGGKVEGLRVKETATEVRVEMAADILFDFDKAVLKPQAEATLRQMASLILSRGNGKVLIEGHTDAKGSNAYNQTLSLQRAHAVRTWLIEKGAVDRARLTAVGVGSQRPVAPNTQPNGADDPNGRQRNRRVELVISK